MALIYKGQPVQLPAGLDVHVLDGRAQDVLDEDEVVPMWFNTKRQFETTPRCVMLHHTGGEGGHKQLFRTLTHRNCSVHFGIDREGRIIQYADLAARCVHGNSGNGYSVGIEITNRGFGTPIENFPRVAYTDVVQGRKRTNFYRFHNVQVEATYKLCMALCHTLAIPFRFPMESGKVRRREMSPEDQKTFSGLIGHMHVHRDAGPKSDPSPHIMDDLLEMYDANSTPTVVEKR